MTEPGVHLETIHPPQHYTPTQIEHGIATAAALSRGKLVLCIPPAGDQAEDDDA